MPRNITDHGTPDRFVTGTVGLPGERTFYLQSRVGADVVSVVLEKQQVSLLAEKMAEMLDEVGRSDAAAVAAEPGAEDLDPLEMPISEAFRVGAFGMGWDTGSHRWCSRSTPSTTSTTRSPTSATTRPTAPTACGCGCPGCRQGFHPPVHRGGLRWASAVPVLPLAAGRRGPYLPTGERLPPLTQGRPMDIETPLDDLADGPLEVVGRLTSASNVVLQCRTGAGDLCA